MVGRAAIRIRQVLGSRWVRSAVVAAVAVASAWNLARTPAAAPLPLLVGVFPWAVGKYVLSPLRWQAISGSGRRLWWHLRVYAEAELLGLLTPAHSGADVWRLHRLRRAGLHRGPAIAELALDRLIGGAGIALAVVVTGVTLPPRVIAVLGAVGVAILAGVLIVRLRRPDLLAKRPLPGPAVLLGTLALSLAFQATILGRLVAVTTALGHPVGPLQLAAVFGASQVAGILPGINGASPRDGALAVGLVSLGLPWTAALAAVALQAMLSWPPAVLLGGASFAARRLAARSRAARRSGYRPALVSLTPARSPRRPPAADPGPDGTLPPRPGAGRPASPPATSPAPAPPARRGSCPAPGARPLAARS
jgi:hypothetical protein